MRWCCRRCQRPTMRAQTPATDTAPTPSSAIRRRRASSPGPTPPPRHPRSPPPSETGANYLAVCPTRFYPWFPSHCLRRWKSDQDGPPTSYFTSPTSSGNSPSSFDDAPNAQALTPFRSSPVRWQDRGGCKGYQRVTSTGNPGLPAREPIGGRNPCQGHPGLRGPYAPPGRQARIRPGARGGPGAGRLPQEGDPLTPPAGE